MAVKVYTTKDSLTTHYNSCKEKKENMKIEKEKQQCELEKLQNEMHILKENNKKEIEKYKNKLKDKFTEIEKYKNNLKDKFTEIEKLKEELHDVKGQLKVLDSNKNVIYDIAKQPKITNTNTNTHTNNKILSIQSSFDFNNTEHVKKLIEEKYDTKYLFQGQKGVAQFAVDYILRDDNGQLKYICTDPSRQIFKYKDSEGFIKKDVDAKKLTGFLVNSGIHEKTYDMAIDFWTDDKGEVDGEKCSYMLEPAQSVKNIENDNSVFKKELINITTF